MYVTRSYLSLQPRPTKGKMRIHCLENVDKSLTFLGEKAVKLENMGAHDIVDGNSRLTLGLIWTIILRFQVRDWMKKTILYKSRSGTCYLAQFQFISVFQVFLRFLNS